MSFSRFFHNISHPKLKRGHSADELGRQGKSSTSPDSAPRRPGPRALTNPGDPGLLGLSTSSTLRNSSPPLAGNEPPSAEGYVASPRAISPDTAAESADSDTAPPVGAFTSTLAVAWEQVKKGPESSPGGTRVVNAAGIGQCGRGSRRQKYICTTRDGSCDRF
ncbi:hypothetical protein FA95DRAFT_1142422 [Auriscalpium vulgare]|uniref:Uncharacterized protein n=1 Tax=Auriscalpium vulgare TaxID=40419 RepID=A0ACB8R4I6_9AGAM|nr:hypothetical protein FA95DRAFT_1142422 [Auriscalpium vulgare]